MFYEISAVEEDILREIISIGMAKVADSLSYITKDSVWLHAPQVQVLNPHDIDQLLPENDRDDIVAQSDIRGDLRGATYILYRKKHADCLAEICIDNNAENIASFNALRRSLMLEVSNILTGALVTQLANIFQMHLIGYPPKLVPFGLRRSFANALEQQLNHKPFVLTIKTDFLNAGICIEFPMLIVFDRDSLDTIVRIIRQKNATGSNWLKK